MSVAPMEWKQLLADTLQEAKVIPLWGNPPPFPWESLSTTLAKEWKIPSLKIHCVKTFWATQEETLIHLGAGPVIIPLEVTPLNGEAYLAIASEDMRVLSKALMQTSSTSPDLPVARGFYQFAVLQALKAFKDISSYPDLHVKIASEKPLPPDSFFTCDISISLPHGAVYAKLLLTQSLLTAFRETFPVKGASYLESPTAQKLPISLRLTVGQSVIPLQEWQHVRVGDFVVLDNCSLAPKQKKGRARFLLHNTALFEVSVRKEKISILDYAFYQEEPNTMNDENTENSPIPEEELSSDESLHIPSEDTMADLESEELPEFHLEDEEEQAELEETTEDKILHTPSGADDMKYVISHSEIPLTVVVEVARMRMNLSKLLQLQPGNVLDLSKDITTGVRLCTGDKCIAIGELVSLGETIGVKITKIGSSQ